MVTPFLKWPGGKSWVYKKYPEIFGTSHKRYIEPFLGSGAVFFGFAHETALLNDLNQELMLTYSAIRDNYEEVVKHLIIHHENHCKEYYYKIRATQFTSTNELAARMIYLNRTCWNGLYRVNLEGKFNVPIGTKKNVAMRISDFSLLAERLKSAELTSVDFEFVINASRDNDLIFADPPYYTNNNAKKFHKYSSKIFSINDHERLASAVLRAHNRGAKVIVTHAHSEKIAEMYGNRARIIYTDRRDTLSGKTEFRGKYKEMIIIME